MKPISFDLDNLSRENKRLYAEVERLNELLRGRYEPMSFMSGGAVITFQEENKRLRVEVKRLEVLVYGRDPLDI
jgi:hypothetical protein